MQTVKTHEERRREAIEAAKVAMEVGVPEAVRRTGVSRHRIYRGLYALRDSERDIELARRQSAQGGA